MNNMQVNKNKLAIIALLILSVGLMVHAQYSFCQSDESFYAALVHRLWLGENLIIDEWHPVQFYTPILLPFYALYRMFVPSGEGVLLFFRILYILFATITALNLLAFCSKRYSSGLSTIAAALCMLYSRANISGPSYYNLCMLFVVNGIVFFSKALIVHKNCVAFISGICFSLAVLCNPYLAPMVILAVCGMLVSKKTRKAAVRFVIAIVVSAVLYLFLGLGKMPFKDILEGLTYIMDEPAHINVAQNNFYSFIEKIKEVLEGCRNNKVLWFSIALVIAVIVFIFGKSSKRIKYTNSNKNKEQNIVRKNRTLSAFCISYSVILISALLLVFSQIHVRVCYLMLLAVTAGMLPYVVFFSYKKKESFPIVLYGIGICVMIGFFFASNTGFDAMTVGACISTIGLILMFKEFFIPKSFLQGVHKSIKIIIRTSAILVLCIVMVSSAAHRILGIYRDAPLSRLNTRITCGPAKGLYTTEDNAAQYYSVYNAILKVYEPGKAEQVFHSQTQPWVYLCTDWGYGTPTAWETSVYGERLMEYYRINEDKIPTLVFLYTTYLGNIEKAPFNNHRSVPSFKIDSFDGEFYESYVLERGDLLIESEHCKVFSIHP